MKLKKILPALFLFLFLFAVSASAKTLQLTIGDPYITVQDLRGIDTNNIDQEGTAPFISNGRTLVPVRVIAESFGSKVGWDDPTDTVTITGKTTVIKLVIGSSTATVNGKNVKLDVPADIYNSRTFVPIRFVSEALGYNVSYVDMTKNVIISDLSAIMTIAGQNVTMDTYNLIKFFDEYDFEGKTSPELVEYSKNVYKRIESAYKKYNYVFSKGETLSEAKKKEINQKMYDAFEDEETLNKILDGVYVSWLEKLAYAEIYDEKYASDNLTPSFDETLIANKYKELYYSVDYIKIAEKNQDNLAKIIETEKAVAAEGFDTVYEKCAADETFSTVKGTVIAMDDSTNVLFDTSVDLEENGVSEAVILDDGYYIFKKSALPAISEEIKAQITENLAESAIKEREDELDGISVEVLISSDDALDLAE